MDQSSATNAASLDTMLGGVLAANQQQSWESTSLPCIGQADEGLDSVTHVNNFDNAIL